MLEINKIYCMDCVEGMKQIGAMNIDLVVTSPPYDCYSDDTEVLTYNDWKLIKDVNVEDKVMSLDPETKEISWSNIKNTYKYSYEGNLMNFKNRDIDILVTPNHKMYVENRDGSPIRERVPFVRKTDLLSSTFLIRASRIKQGQLLRMINFKWKGNKEEKFILPGFISTYNKQHRIYKSISIDMRIWLQFFGLWIAEGSVRGSKGGKVKTYEVSIKQKEGKNIEIIKNIFNAMPFKYNIYQSKTNIYTFSITDKQLWKYLKQFGNSHQKYVPKFIMELDVELLKEFMFYYLLGDGTKREGVGIFNYTNSRSVSNKLNDCLIEISLKLGSASKIKKDFCCYITNKYVKLKQTQTYQKYKGFVYCIELSHNHIIYIRRNGKCCFCGNSLRDYDGYNFNFEETAKHLFRVIKKGGVLVWVVGDATVDGSETGTSFKQALHFKEIGFNLHDTMIYEKHNFSNPSSNRYHQMFEYMFILSKGEPKTFNPIKDKKNRYAGTTSWGTSTSRQKDGSLVERSSKIINEYGMRGNIWKYIIGKGNSTKDEIAYNHPAIFPDKLAEDHILSWSNEGDLVLDPMSGSGTTCKMALRNNRNFMGFDISEKYCRDARTLIAQGNIHRFI